MSKSSLLNVWLFNSILCYDTRQGTHCPYLNRKLILKPSLNVTLYPSLANFIHTLYCSDNVWAGDHTTTSPKKSYKKLTLLFFLKTPCCHFFLIFRETKSSNITAFLTDLTIEIGNYRKLIVDIVRSFKTNVSTLYQQKHRFFVFHVK